MSRFSTFIPLLAVLLTPGLARPAEEKPMTPLPQSDRPLADRFAVPPAASRILKIVHSLPDASADQDGLFRSLIAQGFGGVVTNVSFADYLSSEDKWQAFVCGVTEANKLGMALWLYDERGYPSGNAGGITMRDHPEWEARGVYVADAETTGDPVTLDAPPGKLVRAAAYPLKDGCIALDGAVDLAADVRDGKLAWTPPPGSWRVMIFTEDRLYEGTHAALSLADKLPYINLLQPEPTARFIEVTHAQYAARLGDDLGKYFVATFTDEPSLMSLFLKAQPFRVLPWAPNLPAEFARRRGYPLEPWIPALAADAGPKGKSARYDFWLTVGELVSENFFGQIQEWCRAHHIPSGGHLLLEEPLLMHVPLYGDFFRCIRRLDAPSIDCLTSIPEEVPWFIARLISSAAELEGRRVTMCETSDHCQRYRPAGDTRPVRVVTEDEIRGTCNRLILNGITTITSYYSFSGLSDAQIVRLNEWIGRCCTMLEGGYQVTDVALLYPVESIWPRFAPARHMVADAPAEARQIETVYRAAAESLYTSRRDFTFIDSRTLVNATVEKGVLCCGNLRWHVIVLPCADTLPLKAWENLARLVREGGVVIALTALPANSDKEFPSTRVQALAREMFGDTAALCAAPNAAGGAGVFLPAGCESLLSIVLDALLEPDVRGADRDAPIRVTHRRIDGHDVFFAINDSNQPWEGKLTFAAAGQGEQWSPVTGAVTPCASPQDIALRLGPYDGMLFRFSEARRPERCRLPADFQSLLKMSPLPEVQPGVGKGEFVEGGIAADAAHATAERPAWRATGTLTKGRVDTFLFATFDYAQPVDMSGAACLVVDTWIPKDQRTPTQLVIILRDKNGVEYLAETGRWFNATETSTCYVPRSAFRRAGWSKGPAGPFDFASVTAIRVGWGGYFGAEHERVEFSFSPPRVAALPEL